MSDINKMSRKEILSVPQRDWSEDIGEFDSLIIVPTAWNHDSGYKAMEFVATRDHQPYRRLSGCSDVVHIGGIGGYNDPKWHENPHRAGGIPWSIDCLKTSRLLRLFCGHSYRLVCGLDLSSFEVYPKKKERRES